VCLATADPQEPPGWAAPAKSRNHSWRLPVSSKLSLLLPSHVSGSSSKYSLKPREAHLLWAGHPCQKPQAHADSTGKEEAQP